MGRVVHWRPSENRARRSRQISETIQTEIDAGVAQITLARPDRLNAFTDEMLDAFGDALKSCDRDADIRAVVITGAGRAFSAGQDLDDVRARADDGGMSLKDHLEHTYNRLIRRIVGLEKPVIAAVNGVAAGAGASVAFACDIRYVDPRASFVTAFAKVGLVPDSGSTWFLPRMLGYPRAYELYARGGSFSAEEAARWGVVNHVSEEGAALDDAMTLARELATAPTKALGLTKRAMRRAMVGSLDDALDYEAHMQQIAGETSDHAEGVAAFLEKRSPTFEGR